MVPHSRGPSPASSRRVPGAPPQSLPIMEQSAGISTNNLVLRSLDRQSIRCAWSEGEGGPSRPWGARPQCNIDKATGGHVAIRLLRSAAQEIGEWGSAACH